MDGWINKFIEFLWEITEKLKVNRCAVVFWAILLMERWLFKTNIYKKTAVVQEVMKLLVCPHPTFLNQATSPSRALATTWDINNTWPYCPRVQIQDIVIQDGTFWKKLDARSYKHTKHYKHNRPCWGNHSMLNFVWWCFVVFCLMLYVTIHRCWLLLC